MKTKILSTSNSDLNVAAEILRNGGNVIFPTETVYGLGADANNPEAVKNIFKAKGRPSDNPLIVHISKIEMIDDIAEDVSGKARVLMQKYWPGPLTIILKKCKNVPYETTAGLDTVALRMPEDEVARRLIDAAGIPIAAPSANLSGKPSPTTAQHCIDDMMGRVDGIISGDDCKFGVESTVIDLSGSTPILYRPGAVTRERLEETLGHIDVVVSAQKGETPKSPGLKYKHYSPKADVIILSGNEADVRRYIEKQTHDKHGKIGRLSLDSDGGEIPGVRTIVLGNRDDAGKAMHLLFWSLREMDKYGVDTVYAPEIPDTGEWSAVRNRLYRAAGENIVKV